MDKYQTPTAGTVVVVFFTKVKPIIGCISESFFANLSLRE